MRVITLCVLLSLSSAAYAGPPSWFKMPENTKEEKAEKEKARLLWIKQTKQLRGIKKASYRRQRIFIRRYYPQLQKYRRAYVYPRLD